jgi:oligoendopeptidase F
MCAHVTEEDLMTLHHEMGHLYYYLTYAHQPQMFRVSCAVMAAPLFSRLIRTLPALRDVSRVQCPIDSCTDLIRLTQ